jgi:hypothetical protein
MPRAHPGGRTYGKRGGTAVAARTRAGVVLVDEETRPTTGTAEQEHRIPMAYPKVKRTAPAAPRRPEPARASPRSRSACWPTGTPTAPSRRPSTIATPARTASNEFVFYDGPPFANGLPHYGHLLTGYVKDLSRATRRCAASRVERRFGWDTHGLPAELEAMSQLGIKTTEEIEEIGIEAFNASAARESVLKYTKEWRTTSPARRAGSTSTTTTRPST